MATVNLVDFDPTQDPFWIVFASGRIKASFKRGPCMTVFTNWPRAKLCRVENGIITVICEKDADKHDGRCDNCGADIRAVAQRHGSHWGYSPRAGFQWRKDGSKIAEPLECVRHCMDCYY